MISLLSDPAHALDHRLAYRDDVGWRHLAGAAICAVAVGVLAFTMLGGLFVSLTGLGLLQLGAPAVMVWGVIAAVGAGALYLSVGLAHQVWQFELEAAGTNHIVPPAPQARNLEPPQELRH